MFRYNTLTLFVQMLCRFLVAELLVFVGVDTFKPPPGPFCPLMLSLRES